MKFFSYDRRYLYVDGWRKVVRLLSILIQGEIRPKLNELFIFASFYRCTILSFLHAASLFSYCMDPAIIIILAPGIQSIAWYHHFTNRRGLKIFSLSEKYSTYDPGAKSNTLICKGEVWKSPSFSARPKRSVINHDLGILVFSRSWILRTSKDGLG